MATDLTQVDASDLPEFMTQQRHDDQGFEADRPPNAFAEQALFREALALVKEACAGVVCLDISHNRWARSSLNANPFTARTIDRPYPFPFRTATILRNSILESGFVSPPRMTKPTGF
jgi:hypothetical protein